MITAPCSRDYMKSFAKVLIKPFAHACLRTFNAIFTKKYCTHANHLLTLHSEKVLAPHAPDAPKNGAFSQKNGGSTQKNGGSKFSNGASVQINGVSIWKNDVEPHKN